jgi:hypothetical protein
MESPADVSVKLSDATIICREMWEEGRESISSTPTHGERNIVTGI